MHRSPIEIHMYEKFVDPCVIPMELYLLQSIVFKRVFCSQSECDKRLKIAEDVNCTLSHHPITLNNF